MLFSSINQSFYPELVPLDLIRLKCILVHTLLACSDNIPLNLFGCNRAFRMVKYYHTYSSCLRL